MAVFTCGRFPDGEVPIRTAAGLVWFHDGRAEVDDEMAAALREVPPVFEIVEEGAAPGSPEPSSTPEGKPARPSVRASKAEWVAYASHWHDNREELEAMSKAELIKGFGS